MRCCGLCPEDEILYQHRNKIPQQDPYLPSNDYPHGNEPKTLLAPEREMSTETHNGIEYTKVYTDGSTIHPQSPTLARSGWAVYYAEGSAHNC